MLPTPSLDALRLAADKQLNSHKHVKDACEACLMAQALLALLGLTHAHEDQTTALERRADVWVRVLWTGEVQVCPTKRIVNGLPDWVAYPDSAPALIIAQELVKRMRIDNDQKIKERQLLAELAKLHQII